ncbi:MAG: DMT family transporter [Clostridium sp.]|uniref:DMT family transporter n=1 Tax=Clostridium sp. TaxID=1506 RepID=UPI003F2BFD58
MESTDKRALIAYKKLSTSFERKGTAAGILSGVAFGLNSAVLGVALALAPFTYGASALMAPLVAAAMNDSFAGIWLLLYNLKQGRLKEVLRSFNTKPGKVVCLAAILGGPIANAAYLIAIKDASAAYALPISALFPVFGAILARIFLKQKVSKRIGCGMVLCVVGAAVIGYVPPVGDFPHFYLGIIFAFVAAFGWAAEGTLSTFGTAVIDPKMAINIREITSGLFFLIFVVPVVGGYIMLGKVFMHPEALIMILIAGLTGAITFLSWYKSNSMCGVAKGMALNGTYALWGILFTFLLGKVVITPTLIIGAIIITVGAILVAINPMEFFKKEEI